MKTAMQELHKHFIDAWSSPGDCWNPGKVIDKIESMIEKEKEQIIDFHVMLMKHGLEQEGNGIEWDYNELKKEAEEYYNQTYNQNK